MLCAERCVRCLLCVVLGCVLFFVVCNALSVVSCALRGVPCLFASRVVSCLLFVVKRV